MHTRPASGDRDSVEQFPAMSETPVFQLIDLGQVSEDTNGAPFGSSTDGGEAPFHRYGGPESPSLLDARG
jgi:hypothetical protein